MARKKSSIISIVAIVLVLIMGIGLLGSLFTSSDDSEDKSSNSKVGKSIRDIQLTSSVELKDTYTILYTDGSTSTYVVTNGKDGINGAPGPAGVGIEDHLFSEEFMVEGENSMTDSSNIIELDGVAMNGFLSLLPIIEVSILENTLKSISVTVKTQNNCFYHIPLSYSASSTHIILAGDMPPFMGILSNVRIYIDLSNASMIFLGSDEQLCVEIASTFYLSSFVFSVIT